MAKDPAFLFYTGDFAIGTQFFTNEQVGKYLRLLMAQHQHGHLSEKQMIFICGSYDEDIFQKFTKDESGLYFQERLDTEISRRKNYVSSRSANKLGKKEKIATYDNHMKNISPPYDLHMETENENETKIDTKVKKEPKSIPPDFEPVQQYFSLIKPLHWSIDYANSEAVAWFDRYQSNGWMVGKNKMKDWKAAIRTWIRNDYNFKNKPQSNNGKRLDKNGETIISGRVTEEGAARTLAGLLLHEQRKKDAAGDFVG